MYLLEELNRLYDAFSDEAYAPGVLDGKTKELIALACSVMADCAPCIEYHHAKAAAAGASREEVRDALGITMSVAAGSKRAKYGRLIDDLDARAREARTGGAAR